MIKKLSRTIATLCVGAFLGSFAVSYYYSKHILPKKVIETVDKVSAISCPNPDLTTLFVYPYVKNKLEISVDLYCGDTFDGESAPVKTLSFDCSLIDGGYNCKFERYMDLEVIRQFKISEYAVNDLRCTKKTNPEICKDIKNLLYRTNIESMIGGECRKKENINTPDCIKMNRYIDLLMDCSKDGALNETKECAQVFQSFMDKSWGYNVKVFGENK